MSIFSRFFGGDSSGGSDGGGPGDDGQLVANQQIENPLSLQLLFTGDLPTGEAITAAMRSYHPCMQQGRADVDAELNDEGKLFGLAGWGDHVVKLIGFDQQMPPESVEACVAPSHYGQELKEQARLHQSHVLIYYAGKELDARKQYYALAAMAGVLSKTGALLVMNADARTSLPASIFTSEKEGEDILEVIQALPLIVLFCGFVKYEVEGVDGVWMRTYGAHHLGIPDLAVHAEGHFEGQRYADIFGNIFEYLLESGAVLAAGHTMQIGDDAFLRCRDPEAEEFFLESTGELLAVEIISASDVQPDGSAE